MIPSPLDFSCRPKKPGVISDGLTYPSLLAVKLDDQLFVDGKIDVFAFGQ